jgi:hypothetical protein
MTTVYFAGKPRPAPPKCIYLSQAKKVVDKLDLFFLIKCMTRIGHKEKMPS